MKTAIGFYIAFTFFLLVASAANYAADMDEVIVTGYRVERVAASVSRSIGLLDQASLDSTAHLHIQESLNRLPGVNFHRNDGQEYLAAIRSPVLTGSGSCGSVMTLEDGLPLRPIGFCNVNELFEAHSEQASRIEVLRGPGTAVFGSKALHGAVNILDVAQLNESAKLQVEAGAFGFGRLKVSGGNENWGLSLTTSTESGFRDVSGNDQQKLSLRHFDTLLGLHFDTRLTATNLNQETAGFVVGESAYRDRALSRRNPNPEAFRDASSVRLSTKISQPDEAWQIRPYLRYSDMAFLQHFLPGQPLEENGHRSAGVLSQFRFELNPAFALTTGLDIEIADVWLRQSQENPTDGSEFLQETIPQGIHYDYRVKTDVIGPYAQLEWQASHKLNLGAGIRLEQVNYDYDNLTLTGRTRDDGTACGFGGCRYSRPGDRRDTFANVSPKLDVSYQLNEASLIYLNYSSGFRAPELTELYRLQRDQAVTDLRSEELVSTELGWRFTLGETRYDVALYTMNKDNVILRDVDFFNVSDGRTNHRGVEAQVNWQISEHFDLNIAGSYAKHEYVNNPGLSETDIIGNDIDTAPRRLASSQLRYNNHGTAAELEWQSTGAYFTDPENANSYGGHNIFHLRFFQRFGENIRASLRINNVFDTTYAERADFSGFDGERFFPGLPRRAYLGVEFSL